MQHITLGWGRDYGDVSPIRGVLVGGDEHTLSVAVDVVARGEMEAYEGDGALGESDPGAAARV